MTTVKHLSFPLSWYQVISRLIYRLTIQIILYKHQVLLSSVKVLIYTIVVLIPPSAKTPFD